MRAPSRSREPIEKRLNVDRLAVVNAKGGDLVRNHLLWGVAVFAIHASTLNAQDPPARPRFEVASVKECKATDPHPPSTNSPGRISLSCWPLWRLLIDAYQLFPAGKLNPLNPAIPVTPMDGGRDLINSKYSIDAKAEGPASVLMMIGPMMQTLLEDRFRPRAHRETREIPVYIMTVAKDGLKMQLTKEGSCIRYDPTDFAQSATPPGDKPWCVIPTGSRRGSMTIFDAHGIGLDVYATLVRADRPVIDRTGLTGTYDIHLEWMADEPAARGPDAGTASDPPGTALIAAIRKQLGLQLEPAKGPYEFFVIDHVERPTGN
jgi:uncharacterized protein (TIGR03435 family)